MSQERSNVNAEVMGEQIIHSDLIWSEYFSADNEPKFRSNLAGTQQAGITW